MMTGPPEPTVTWPRAALFDLDGTLIDSVPDIAMAVGELMASEGLEPFPEAEVRDMVGLGVRVLVRRALDRRGRTLDDVAFEGVMARMLEIYPRHLTGRTTLMPGAVATLDALAEAGSALALVTNKMQAATEIVLEHFGLTERFRVILGDQVGRSELATKPAPDMLLFALAQLGIAPGEALMVGDSGADMQSSIAAGTFTVGVRGGYSDKPLESFGPDVVIDSLVQFPEAIAAWRGR